MTSQQKNGATGEFRRDDTAKTMRHGLAPGVEVVGALIAVAGPLAGRAWAVFDGENSIGRDSRCEISFPEDDIRISRRHARLVHRAGSFGIEPTSDQPTRVDLTLLEKGPPAPLADGAKVHMGWTEFVFRTV